MVISKTCSFVCGDEVLDHRCRQCLIQLAGFKEDFFDNQQDTIKSYATAMVHGILKMMNEYVNYQCPCNNVLNPLTLGFTINIAFKLVATTSKPLQTRDRKSLVQCKWLEESSRIYLWVH